jgi:hypothetical protein
MAGSDSARGSKTIGRLPDSALSTAEENLVGMNSEGRSGPFGMASSHTKAKGQPKLAHRLAEDGGSVVS